MHHTLFQPASATHPPRAMVIAELGVNHDGQLARALELVRAAAEAGADAIKLQWFDPDRLLSNQAMLAGYQAGGAADAHALLRGLMLDLDAMRQVRDAARQAGLRCIATLFSPDDRDGLAVLELDAVKTASPDAVNPPLLRAAASLGRPLLISTGTCALDELGPAAALLADHEPGGCLLQCVSSYPTPSGHAALGAISVLRDRFALPCGYSDHTLDLHTGALAVAAGAVVLEKHLTHDRQAVGPDHAASLEPGQFAEYVAQVRQAEMMLGPACKAVLPIEADVRQVARQSVCLRRALAAGSVLNAADLTVKRPGTGIPASAMDAVLGRRLARSVRANDLLQWDDLADA